MPRRSGTNPRASRARLETLLGFVGFFAFMAVVTVVVVFFRGEPAVFEAIVAGVLCTLFFVLLRRYLR